jgi:hypothetical protein
MTITSTSETLCTSNTPQIMVMSNITSVKLINHCHKPLENNERLYLEACELSPLRRARPKYVRTCVHTWVHAFVHNTHTHNTTTDNTTHIQHTQQQHTQHNTYNTHNNTRNNNTHIHTYTHRGKSVNIFFLTIKVETRIKRAGILLIP